MSHTASSRQIIPEGVSLHDNHTDLKLIVQLAVTCSFLWRTRFGHIRMLHASLDDSDQFVPFFLSLRHDASL